MVRVLFQMPFELWILYGQFLSGGGSGNIVIG